MSQTQLRKRHNFAPALDFIRKFGSILLVAAIAFGGYFAAHNLLPGSGHNELDEDHSTVEVNVLEDMVTLTNEKLKAAKLTTSKAVSGEFQQYQKVPGTISYDATKKVDLRASVTSIVSDVLVQPGQSVKAGEQLLILEGPEIGQARIAIEQASTNAALTEKESGWANETNENLKELIALLNQRPTVEQVNSAFNGRTLGEHRDEILSAYSQLLLAKKSFERGSNVNTSGVIPGRVLDERRSSMEVAEAKYKGMIEESRFQSAQDYTKAKAKFDAANSELKICRENLKSLIGPYGDYESISSDKTNQNLSRFALKAPRDGQIVELKASKSARFAAGEVMVVIAETRDVWVEAQIPQQDIASLSVKAGQSVGVSVPGVNESSYAAIVRFFNATVSPTTLAVPLVLELDNSNQIFRPGMFVWVNVPKGEPANAITVPVGAIQRDGDDTFVFRAEGGGKFRRLEVEVGSESAGQAEIRAGLNAGDEIVDSGAFFLKSELLLEAE